MPTPQPTPQPTPRPAPEHLSTLEAGRRQLDYWLVVYRRTWRSTVTSSFLVPLLYVVALGVLLGGFVDADPSRLEGASSYLAFVAPGLVCAHAMQTAVGETTFPVASRLKWEKTYYAQQATPLEPRHLAAAHLAFVALRLLTTCTVFGVVMVPFGVYATWWGPLLALPVQVLVGMVFACGLFGISVRIRTEEAFGVIFRLGVLPLFLFSGAFFPVTNLGDVGAWIARLTPLWHGVNLSRMLVVDHLDPVVAVVNLAVLVVLLVLGWRWATGGLQKRLVS